MQTIATIVVLHVEGHVIKATSAHPIYTSNGWVDAGYLRAGDLLCTHDGTWATVQAVAVEEEQHVHQLVPGFMPYPSSGLLPAGTLIPTAAGLKKVEDIEAGDYVLVPSSQRN